MPQHQSTPTLDLSDRQLVSTGTPWESKVGYSRAVRVGPLVYVTGTLAADAQGVIHHADDPYEQTVYALRKIEAALHEAGASLEHVVRTRLYVTDLALADDIGRAHHDVLGHVRPCATMLEVSGMFTDEAVVEIEVDAVIG